MTTRTTDTAQTRYDQALEIQRTAERELSELRVEQSTMHADLEALRVRRQREVLRGDHHTIDATEGEIRRVERALERQAMLVSEADACVQDLAAKAAPLAAAAQAEVTARRVAELHERGREVLAMFRKEVLARAEQLVPEFFRITAELRRLEGSNQPPTQKLEDEMIFVGSGPQKVWITDIRTRNKQSDASMFDSTPAPRPGIAAFSSRA